MDLAAPYDLTLYEHVWDFPPASVDRRHLFWMYDILCRGGFRNVLEIGCFYGASSTAFVGAVNRQAIGGATFCDIEIHPHLRNTLSRCQFPDRIRIFEGPSRELLQHGEEFDFVFVDGDHRLLAVAEEVELLLKRRPVCVMAHVTNAQAAGLPDCDGPPLLKWRFMTAEQNGDKHLDESQPSPDSFRSYICLEDSAVRPGELTHRGMFFATTSKAVFDVARRSLRKWGCVAEPQEDRHLERSEPVPDLLPSRLPLRTQYSRGQCIFFGRAQQYWVCPRRPRDHAVKHEFV